MGLLQAEDQLDSTSVHFLSLLPTFTSLNETLAMFDVNIECSVIANLAGK